MVRGASTYCHGLNGVGSFTQYEGGMVSSYQLFSQKYGYFETRAAMPPTSVPGLQESLWLYPENEKLYGPWPDSGEIDYAEFYSDLPDADVPVTHYPGSSNDPNANIGACTIPGDATAGQFNTYAVSWTPTTITTYFNGVACMTDTYGPYVTNPDVAPEPFDQPFFLAFTSALGIGSNQFQPGTTPLPATMHIDWVRVWQSSVGLGDQDFHRGSSLAASGSGTRSRWSATHEGASRCPSPSPTNTSNWGPPCGPSWLPTARWRHTGPCSRRPRSRARPTGRRWRSSGGSASTCPSNTVEPAPG